MSRKKVLSKFTILCWAAFIATVGVGVGWAPLHPLPTPKLNEAVTSVITLAFTCPLSEHTGNKRRVDKEESVPEKCASELHLLAFL